MIRESESLHLDPNSRSFPTGRPSKDAAAPAVRDAQRPAQASAHPASRMNVASMLSWSVVDRLVPCQPSVHVLVARITVTRRAARVVGKQSNDDRSVASDCKDETRGRQIGRAGKGWMEVKRIGCTWMGEKHDELGCVDGCDAGVEMEMTSCTLSRARWPGALRSRVRQALHA